MGYSLSWVAARDKGRSAILDELRLEGTGEREEIPESDMVRAELPKGFTLLLANNSDRFVKEKLLGQLSAKRELLACFVEEHVMVSLAAGWKNGRELWSVLHDAQVAIDHLQVEGRPPAELAPIKERLLAQQAADTSGEVDYVFDVPVELAKVLTGFRHDQDIEGVEGDAFEVLASAARKRR